MAENISVQKKIAERYFAEMLEAERDRDFAAWCKRWDASDLEGFSEETFLKDVEAMHRKLGGYIDREYFGALKGLEDSSQARGTTHRLRFVWRVIYEKNEALFVVGIREIEGTWYAYENMCSV